MPDKKKNFILVNNLGGGGAERQISYISRLKEIEKVICLEPLNAYAIDSSRIVYLFSTLASKSNLLKKAWRILLIPYKLKKAGISRHTNLLCFLHFSYIVGYITKILFGCNLIICIRTNPISYYQKTAYFKMPLWLFKMILRKADTVVSNSKTTALMIQETYKLQQSKFIQNGYDIQGITTLAQESLGNYEALFAQDVLVHSGRLEFDKGQWHLLRIFNEIVKQKPDTKLVILGVGSYAERLYDLCIQLGLTYHKVGEPTVNIQNQVFFLGFQTNPYKFYRNAKLFIFPSIFEGLPNAPIEALICKTPCIISDCKTGPREILLPESNLLASTDVPLKSPYGFLLPSFDGQEIFDNSPLMPKEQMWAQCTIDLLHNEELRQSMKKNCDIIKQRYEITTVLHSWKELLI